MNHMMTETTTQVLVLVFLARHIVDEGIGVETSLWCRSSNCTYLGRDTNLHLRIDGLQYLLALIGEGHKNPFSKSAQTTKKCYFDNSKSTNSTKRCSNDNFYKV